MFTVEMKKMPLTHSSTAEQEDKQEERGSCQTLHEIDLKDWSFKNFFNFSKFTVA